MAYTDITTIGAIHAVVDAIQEHMQNVTTIDDHHMTQMRCLIDALFLLKEGME